MSNRRSNSAWLKMVLKDSFQRPITIRDAMRQQGLSKAEAEQWLKYMVQMGRLKPSEGNQSEESQSYHWMPDPFFSRPFKQVRTGDEEA